MFAVANLAAPSRSTLIQTPAKVLTFLIAIATRSPIRGLMYEAGYRNEDHTEGWRLLTAVGTFRDGLPTATASNRARSAHDEIHAWVTTNFMRYQAALTRLYPAWIGLFPYSNPLSPAESLLAIATLLDALRKSDASKDAALLETLSNRGLTSAEVGRLRRLVKVAQSVEEAPSNDLEHEQRTDELLALYHWYRDWAESAKRFVKRKDYRAALGLARIQKEEGANSGIHGACP